MWSARLPRHVGSVALVVAIAILSGRRQSAADEAQGGVLRFITSYKNELDGLDGATSIAMSRDGLHLYAAANFSRTLLLFHRDGKSGELRLHRTYQCRFARPKLAGAVQLPVSLLPKCLVLSPDGKQLYTAGSQLIVFARDAETGEVTFVGAIDQKPLVQIESFTISPDGRNAYAVGAVNSTLGVYLRDAQTGALRLLEVFQDVKALTDPTNKVEGARQTDHLGSPQAVCVSPDGKHVYVAASRDWSLTVLARDEHTGALTLSQTARDVLERGRITPHDRGLMNVGSLAISSDGQLVYTTSPSGRVSVFERHPATGGLSWRTTFHDDRDVPDLGYPKLVYASPDNEMVYVACREDRSVAVFRREPKNRNTLRFVHAIRDEENGVDGVSGVCAFASDASGKQLYTLSQEQAITLFAVENPPMPDSPAPEKPLASGGRRVPEEAPSYELSREGDPLRLDSRPVAIAFTHGDQTLSILTGRGQLVHWDLATGLTAPSLTLRGPIQLARFSPDGNWLVAVRARRVEVWSLQAPTPSTWKDFDNGILDVDISPDGKRIAVALSDQTVTVWERETGLTILQFSDFYNGGGSAANHVRFSPDGTRVANTCAGHLRWLRLDGRSERICKTARYVCPVQFSRSGDRLAFSEDRLRILDGATGDLLTSFDHRGRDWPEFSPDCQLLALTARGDMGSEIISAVNGERIAELPNGRGPNAAFSSDSKLLAMAAVDHALHPGKIFVSVWRLAPHEP